MGKILDKKINMCIEHIKSSKSWDRFPKYMKYSLKIYEGK